LAARDFLSVKIWDVAMPNKPLNVIPIQESLKSKLYEMFDNEHISDSFSISANRDSRTLVTGSFNSHFHFMDLIDGVNVLLIQTNTQYELSFNRKTISKPMTNKVETLGNIDYARSTNYSRFSPKGDTAVVASLNCFFIYSL
jgi:serine/threonine-protein phosphatase 2A regulatory subunit B